MRKNKLFTITAVIAAFMMLATACGSSAKETTAASETTVETTAAASDSDESATAEAVNSSIESNSDEETETTAAIQSGSLDTSNKFTAVSGKYEIIVPNGWIVEPESDETLTTFTSADGNDYIEINYETGDIEAMVEKLPATSDEYMQMISRGDNSMEIVSYNVTTSEDGNTQIFQYAIKDNAEDSDAKYTYVTGKYDLNAKTFISATGIASTSGDEIIKTIDTAMNSFKINE